MPLPLEVTKRPEGQRVTSRWQPATQTNRDPNRDKTRTRSNQPRTSETYRRQDDVFGYKQQLQLSGVVPVFQNLNYKLQKNVWCAAEPTKSSKVIKKEYVALGGLHEDKLCDILQAMVPTNIEAVHQTFLFQIESNPDRLGRLSPTHGQRSQQQSGQITLQSVPINKPKFFKATHQT